MKFTLPAELFEKFVFEDHDGNSDTDNTSISITGLSNLTSMPTGNVETTIGCSAGTYTLTISGYAKEIVKGVTKYYPLTYKYVFKSV